MGNVIPPEYNTPLDADQLNSSIPISVLYSVTPDNRFIPVRADAQGALSISGTISVGTVTIEGVDPVDSSSHPLAIVNFGPDGYALRSAIFDGGNQLIVNPDGSINVAGSSTPTVLDNGSITAGQTVGLNSALLYGFNGVTWERIDSTSNRLVVDGSQVTQPVSGIVIAKIEDTSGNSLTSTSGSLNVNITGGVSSGEQHTLDSSGDTYTPGTTKGTAVAARVVSSSPSLTATQFSDLTLTTAGRLIVDGSQVTQPVSGIVTANQGTPNTASNKWPIEIVDSAGVNIATVDATGDLQVDVNNFPATIAITQSTSPWVVSLSSTTITGTVAVTQSTSPWVISGTVTANAGTNLNTSALALDTTVAALEVSQGSTTSGEKGILIQAAATTSPPTYINGQTSPLTLTLAGRLRSDIGGFGGTDVTLGQKTMASSMPVVIASDQSDVGINIDKYGGTSTTLGQKVMASSIPVTLAIDQPTLSVSVTGSTDLASGKVFYAAIDNYNLATAGSNNPIFLFKNPIGSGKTMNVFSVTGNCKVTNVQVTFLMFKNPTITTDGTPFTPANANFGSSNISVANIFKSSTVSSSGTLVVIDQVGQNSNSSNMVIIEQIAVSPGQTMLIAGNPFSNNRAVILSVGWTEN
jgi:hypothetical protein